MQEETSDRIVRIEVEVVDSRRVERRSTTNKSVHNVALVEEQLGKVRAVLPGDSGDQCSLAVVHRELRRKVVSWLTSAVRSG